MEAAGTGTESVAEAIRRLKKDRKAVILAHNYQRPEVQDAADFVGDSLGLTRQAAETDAEVIVFCGVHFMAETAAIMNPGRTVLLPDPAAGCSLASMISAASLRRWKAAHPGAAVVSYINCTAEVKAESDVICTSTNALRIVESLPADREILFVPDQYLGAWVRGRTRRKIRLWPGYCHVHTRIDTDRIVRLKGEHPAARFLMHPECGCMSTCLPLADEVLSTEGIVGHCRRSPDREFIVGTEVGILHRLRKENPGKSFYPAADEASCEYMKLVTLDKLLESLEERKHRVEVPEEVARKARAAIGRMLEVSDPGGYVRPAGAP